MSRCAPRPGAGKIFLTKPFDGPPEELVLLERAELPAALRGEALFGNDRPYQVEIGFGKGRSLIAAAEQQPEQNWLGIELSIPYVRLAAKRAGKRGLANLRLLRAEAGEVFSSALEPGKVTGVHVFYPDPWPKKRHHKRRLVQLAFLELLERTVAPGALFRLATDHAQYFEQMQEVFAVRQAHWTAEPNGWEGYTPTNYELKYEAAGRTINRLAFRCQAGVGVAAQRSPTKDSNGS